MMVPSKLIVEICAPNGIFRAPIKHEHNKSSSRAQIDILQPKTKNQSHAEDKVSSTGPCSRLFFAAAAAVSKATDIVVNNDGPKHQPHVWEQQLIPHKVPSHMPARAKPLLPQLHGATGPTAKI